MKSPICVRKEWNPPSRLSYTNHRALLWDRHKIIFYLATGGHFGGGVGISTNKKSSGTSLLTLFNPTDMTKKTICVFAGDGVGPEVTAEAIKILHVIEKATDLTIDFQHKLMGGCAIDATGNPLPDDSLACAKAADAVLLGAVGGPKWGTGKVRPEQGMSNCLEVN